MRLLPNYSDPFGLMGYMVSKGAKSSSQNSRRQTTIWTAQNCSINLQTFFSGNHVKWHKTNA